MHTSALGPAVVVRRRDHLIHDSALVMLLLALGALLAFGLRGHQPPPRPDHPPIGAPAAIGPI